MPRIALYLVAAQRRLTLQVVCLGLAHFRLSVRPPKAPSRPTGENPTPSRELRQAMPGWSGRWIAPEGKVAWIVSAICGSSMRAITRMGFWHTGQRGGST
jgi:hypothetical protein